VTGGLYELVNEFTEALYSSITNESYFMKKVFILQYELSLFLILFTLHYCIVKLCYKHYSTCSSPDHKSHKDLT